MTTATLEERVAIVEQRIATLEAERGNLATKADVDAAVERAINTLTWRLITAFIALAGVLVTAMASSAYVVVNAINIAVGS